MRGTHWTSVGLSTGSCTRARQKKHSETSLGDLGAEIAGRNVCLSPQASLQKASIRNPHSGTSQSKHRSGHMGCLSVAHPNKDRGSRSAKCLAKNRHETFSCGNTKCQLAMERILSHGFSIHTSRLYRVSGRWSRMSWLC
jgi:hypothetical protein